MDLTKRMRQEVARMERPQHGGDGWRYSGLEDFSANLNPFGPPPGLQEMLLAASKQLDHYPDDSSDRFRRAVADHHSLVKENVVPGVGSSEIIRLFPEVFLERGDKVLMPRPTFGEYAFACRFMGAEVVPFTLPEEDAFRVDVESLLGELDRSFKAVYLCNPNNPTGMVCPRRQVLELLQECERLNVIVFLDETLLELLPDEAKISLSSEVEAHDNLLIIRSLTKSFAIPGLRVGYGLAGKSMAACLERGRQTWNLGQIEQEVSAALISDHFHYVRKGAQVLDDEKRRVHQELGQFRSLTVHMPDGFFFFLDLRPVEMTGAGFRERMMEQGVLVRDCRSFGPPFESYVRFCVKTPEKDALLLKAFRAVLGREDRA